MKTLRVSAAVIVRDGMVFATQRGSGEFRDMWEFPGGKIEAGETAEAALIREIREELDADICIDERLCTVEYEYPSFHLEMQCFICSLISKKITLLEHESARWLGPDDIHTVDWLPADQKVLAALISRYAGGAQTSQQQRTLYA